jgi:uncharacterized protein YecT (DUF1311 family)
MFSARLPSSVPACLWLALCVVLALPGPAHAQNPYWSCAPYLRSGKCPEVQLCTNPALLSLDIRLNAAYHSIRSLIPQSLQKPFRKYQVAWNAQRDLCGCNAGCLAQEYEQRVAYLESILQPRTGPSAGAPQQQPSRQPSLQPSSQPLPESEACAKFPFLC